MIKFLVLQIRRQDYHSVLETKVKVEPNYMLIEEAWRKWLYHKACYITANDLDEVFRIGNIGPEDSIERLGSMYSISVGDVIVITSNQKMVYVDNFGFERLPALEQLLELEGEKL